MRYSLPSLLPYLRACGVQYFMYVIRVNIEIYMKIPQNLKYHELTSVESSELSVNTYLRVLIESCKDGGHVLHLKLFASPLGGTLPLFGHLSYDRCYSQLLFATMRLFSRSTIVGLPSSALVEAKNQHDFCPSYSGF